jgi:hypothetical protein
VFRLQDETAENINRLLERFLPEVESQLRGRALTRAVVVERGIRPVEVSRYLGSAGGPRLQHSYERMILNNSTTSRRPR